MGDDYLYLSYAIWVRVWHDGGAWRPWHAIVGAGPMQYGEAGSTTYAAWTRAGSFRRAMRFAGKQVVATHVRYLETGELPPGVEQRHCAPRDDAAPRQGTPVTTA